MKIDFKPSIIFVGISIKSIVFVFYNNIIPENGDITLNKSGSIMA